MEPNTEIIALFVDKQADIPHVEAYLMSKEDDFRAQAETFFKAVEWEIWRISKVIVTQQPSSTGFIVGVSVQCLDDLGEQIDHEADLTLYLSELEKLGAVPLFVE